MKFRVSLFLLSFFLTSYLFSSKNAVSISPIFLMQSINTKVKHDDSKTNEDYKKIVKSSSTDIYSDSVFGFGLSLDFNADFLYFSFAFAFPHSFKTQFINAELTHSKYNSVIGTIEVGFCYKTFEGKPYNLIFQLGLGFMAFHVKATGDVPDSRKISHTRTDLMLGLGGNIVFTYYFNKVIGIYFGIGDMFHFMNLKTYRIIEFSTGSLVFEEKIKTENFNAINTFANSFSVKAGLSFAF